jgi:hypothetical protein
MPTVQPLTQDPNRVLLSGTLAEPVGLYDLSPGPLVCFLRLCCEEHSGPATLGDSPLDVSVLLLGARAASTVSELLAGRRVLVDGALASAAWESSAGEPGEAVCVIARRIQFLDAAERRSRRIRRPSPAMIGFSEDVWT